MSQSTTSALRRLSWVAAALAVLLAAWAIAGLGLSPAWTRAVFAMAFAVLLAAGWLRRLVNHRSLWAIEASVRAIAGAAGEPMELHGDTPSGVARALARTQRDTSAVHSRLAAERDELQAIFEALGNGLLVLDREQRIRGANRIAERLLGLEAGYQGRLLQQATRQPDLSRFVGEALTADGHLRAELRLEGVEPLTAQVASERLPGPDGRLDGLIIVLDDITRLKRLESMRTDFAANVSHELRTPITNIKGYVETLQELGAGDPAQLAQFLSIISSNTERLSKLVEDLLSLASLDQADAQDHLDFSEVDLVSLLAAVRREFETTAATKEVTLRVSCDPAARIVGNATLVHQAVANLVSNAIRYSPPGSTVIVNASEADGAVVLSVQDDGPGIASKHLPRIFERFYRIDKARSRELGGTGLGLALVKHIALAHGGRVTVDSTPGEGSRFALVLPGIDAGKQLFQRNLDTI